MNHAITSTPTLSEVLTAVNIWDGTPVRETVMLTPYVASGSDTAVIVCPGGSYFWLDLEVEGHGVARWLQRHGISAFVLEYRTAGLFAFITRYRLLGSGNRFPCMLQDVQRAIQIVREGAVSRGADLRRMGVMGFSAGGHVALMSGLFFDRDVLGVAGVECDVNLRPDFVASVYPVVTLTGEYAHKRSRRGLLGDGFTVDRAAALDLSLERHVRPDMPPVFLVNCVDDPVVDYRNSVILDRALTEAGVPHRYTQYHTGGHGFGASAAHTTSEAIAWKTGFLDWLDNLKL